MIVEMLEAAIKASKTEFLASSEWFVLKAFLWTAWQRCLMLHFLYVLNVQLSVGYDSNRNKFLTLRGTSIVKEDNLSMLAAQKAQQEQDWKIAPYMCRWALELLRTDRASMALDFRHLYRRYSNLFGNRPPRCVKTIHGATRPCEGDSPYKCSRFHGLKIEDQSAHSADCVGDCESLFWNEDSYRKIQGSRAVLLGQVQGNLLEYCTASKNTMAVSHVWSHGQGGRPELGETSFNSCLHNRYSTIARSSGCDSYWMDTPCIPQDHQLRLEAIQKHQLGICWKQAYSHLRPGSYGYQYRQFNSRPTGVDFLLPCSSVTGMLGLGPCSKRCELTTVSIYSFKTTRFFLQKAF